MSLIEWRFILGDRRWLPDIGSLAIAWFSAGHLSHVDTIIPEGIRWAQKDWLYGARSNKDGAKRPGVWPRPPNYADFRTGIIMSIPVTDEQYNKFWESERTKFGMPYDHTDIWAYFLNRDWRQPDSWTCSEKNADSALTAGIFPQAPYLSSNKITPVMLATLVSILPGVQIRNITG